MRMRWPLVGLNSVVAPFTAQKFVVFTKLSARNQAQCIVVHVSSTLNSGIFLVLPVLCLDAEFLMQTETLENAVSILSKTFLCY